MVSRGASFPTGTFVELLQEGAVPVPPEQVQPVPLAVHVPTSDGGRRLASLMEVAGPEPAFRTSTVSTAGLSARTSVMPPISANSCGDGAPAITCSVACALWPAAAPEPVITTDGCDPARAVWATSNRASTATDPLTGSAELNRQVPPSAEVWQDQLPRTGLEPPNPGRCSRFSAPANWRPVQGRRS
jgi:hypothetical protein